MDLHARVVARFLEVNGEHPMTAADDRYVDQYFVPLHALSEEPDVVREHMLAGRLPLPSYLRSDRTEMVPADFLAMAEQAGGVTELAGWFARQDWPSPEVAGQEWRAYLSGQYVCLKSVTPQNIRRKAELVAAIDTVRGQLSQLVDELDALEPPFTAYDRLRFNGPVSRDTHIDALRTGDPVLSAVGGTTNAAPRSPIRTPESSMGAPATR